MSQIFLSILKNFLSYPTYRSLSSGFWISPEGADLCHSQKNKKQEAQGLNSHLGPMSCSVTVSPQVLSGERDNT